MAAQEKKTASWSGVKAKLIDSSRVDLMGLIQDRTAISP